LVLGILPAHAELVPPLLVINPRSDEAFARRANRLVEDGIATPYELEQELRREHPRAVVRARGLSGEPPIWYVYREGTWIPSTDR
jgi:hypothetical protein